MTDKPVYERRTVTLGGALDRPVVLGSPDTVIVVPITATTLGDAVEQWRQAAESGADMVEWRLDRLEDLQDLLPEVHQLAEECREKWGLPVIATIRTIAEGGSFAQMDAYPAFVGFVSEWADAIDVEVDRPGSQDLISGLKGQVPIVASFHQYAHAPNAALIQKLLSRMNGTGAHIVKIAWMARSDKDTREVAEAADWARSNIGVPSVVIGMGEAGQQTRLGEAARHAAFAFATVGGSSAPGQPTIDELRESVR